MDGGYGSVAVEVRLNDQELRFDDIGNENKQRSRCSYTVELEISFNGEEEEGWAGDGLISIFFFFSS